MTPKKAVSKRKANPSPAKSKSGPATFPFEKWTVEKLQKEVKKYGFKTSRSRNTLIDQLKAVHQALAVAKVQSASPVKGTASAKPLLPSENDAPILASPTKAARGQGRKSDPFLVPSSSSSRSNSPTEAGDVTVQTYEAGDLTLQLEQEDQSHTDSSSDVPLAHQKSSLVEEDADEGAGVRTRPQFASTMAKAVKQDMQLWLRILHFEPINFEEFVSVAVQSGLPMDSGRQKIELRSWLDRQCICFYTADLTGPRSRH